PLCQPQEGGPAESIQHFAGATPGLRQLELISKLPGGAPASICPKVIEGDSSAPSFGYNPAMRALLRRMRSVLEQPPWSRAARDDSSGRRAAPRGSGRPRATSSSAWRLRGARTALELGTSPRNCRSLRL